MLAVAVVEVEELLKHQAELVVAELEQQMLQLDLLVRLIQAAVVAVVVLLATAEQAAQA
jgi:hypothetical protein